jgi:hypothetical protein
MADDLALLREVDAGEILGEGLMRARLAGELVPGNETGGVMRVPFL